MGNKRQKPWSTSQGAKLPEVETLLALVHLMETANLPAF